MIDNLAKIWTAFTPAEKHKAFAMLALMVLVAIVDTVGVVSIMPFLSVLSRPEVIHENHWLATAYQEIGFTRDRDFMIALGLASIALVVASSVFRAVANHLLNRLVHLQRHSLSARLLSRYLNQPYEFFLMRNPSVLAKNVLADANLIISDMVHPLSQMLAQGIVVLAMALLILLYDPWMALWIGAILGALYGGIYALVRKRLARTGHELDAANIQRFKATTEVLQGIKDVKVSHAISAYQQRFDQASRLHSRHLASSDTLNQSPLYLVEATGYGGLILIAIALLVRSGDVAQVLPTLGLYGFAAYRLLPAAQIIYRGFAKLRLSSAILDSVHEDLKLPSEPVAQPGPVMVPHHEVRLQGIRYAYPAAPDKPVIDHLDLVIPANTSLGIAGRSGAGKSTVMDILLGLLPLQSGTLSVDGTPITADNLATWQRSIGYVPQNIYLADATVAENIAFGVPPQAIDMRAVERAARAAQIHDFVANDLPYGYDTNVGANGIRLSGGQRQRIGMARALYRDPPVLLLDEATSALDSETEKALVEAIRSLSGTKTIVVIAHREASLKYCDRVVSIGETRTVQAPQAETRAR